jgi:uncharacterized repeat protein (TIGR02543 family)
VFVEWNTAANGSGTSYGVTYAYDADVTLFAQWTVTSHTVVFDANGGSGSMSPETHNVATALPANSFTRSGFDFIGWNTAADGSGASYADQAVYAYDADVTLFAQWTASSHTVTFDANGGSGSMSPETHYLATALPANSFSRAGYRFTGWNTAADGLGTSYADQGSYPFDADVTLFAQWTAKTLQSITFGLLADRTLLQSPFTVNASASSGLPVTFTTTTPAVCTASGFRGKTITLVATGICTVRATQAGNSFYKPASVSRSFTVTRVASTAA